MATLGHCDKHSISIWTGEDWDWWVSRSLPLEERGWNCPLNAFHAYSYYARTLRERGEDAKADEAEATAAFYRMIHE